MPTNETQGAKGRVDQQLHAGAVCVDGRATLILGASGSGKSGLALQLMAFGALLISDDRTDILDRDGWPFAACPDTIRGRIEARGLGILTAQPAPPAPVVLAIQMDRIETARLPPERTITILGRSISLLHKVESVHFAPAVFQYLKMAATGISRP